MKFSKINFLIIFTITLISKLAISQTFNEILSRPSNNSITMSILFDQSTEVYWEYGLTSGTYTANTPTYNADTNSALMVDFANLQSNKKYYYRTRYRASDSTSAFLAGTEHTFRTARTSGNTFTFAIEADPHLDTNSLLSSYTLTLQNILSKNPDFLIDLGDIFMSEKLPVINQTEISNRHKLYRPLFGAICHSVPLYLVLGNHEGELGWRLNNTDTCLPVMASKIRKTFYANPLPSTFYTGDSIPENFVGLRQNYYAWEWGNALFVVLDPFWYTITKPDWGWTLGLAQYNWFKNVLTNSQAKFKFVFCHNLVGGKGNDARGGSEYADFFEMGGNNADSIWGFDFSRLGWQKPIHTLMRENNVNVFFHGHDHFYGKQDKDGIVYQEVPQPSNKNITNISAALYGYVDGVLLPGRGYLLVTVTDTSVKVDYIKTYLPNEETGGHSNQEMGATYTIFSTSTGIEIATPSTLKLEQNYPNPFNNETTIKYEIPSKNNVTIKVFDIFGREKATLLDKEQHVGKHSINLDANKLSLSSGIYYCKLSIGKESKSIKIICIK